VINSALSTLPSLGERDMHTKYDMMICCKKNVKFSPFTALFSSSHLDKRDV
jgi:hypothetical protein